MTRTKPGWLLSARRHHQREECSECLEDSSPREARALVIYHRGGYQYCEPVCGARCASIKLRDLAKSARPPDEVRIVPLPERP